MTFEPNSKSFVPCRPESAPGTGLDPALAPMPYRDEWIRAAAIIGAGIAGLIAMFWEAASGAVGVWYESPTFNHCFLIIPIVCYLIWRRRERLMAAPPRPALICLVALPVIGLGWLAGDIADVLIVQQFALLAMIQVFVLTVIGWRAAWVISFPLFYLVFAVPFGKFMVAPLQDFTAMFVVKVLRLIDIPVFLEGVFMTIPTGNFEVAETCSGVRFLIATLALGFLFSHLSFRAWWRHALFMALAFTVPIIANGLRGFGIVYLAYSTDNKLAVGVDHLVYGWIFFSLVTIVLLAIGMKLRDDDDERTPVPVASAAPAARKSLVVPAVLALALAGVAPAYAGYIEGYPPDPSTAQIAFPDRIGSWSLLPGRHDRWQPRFPSADVRQLATYAKGDRRVHLYVAYYAFQRQGAEVTSDTNAMDGPVWSRSASGATNVPIESETVRVRWMRLLSNDRRRLVWHWYWIGGDYAADKYHAKILEAKAKLLGLNQAGAAIAVGADFDESTEEAAVSLRDFLGDFEAIRKMLVRASEDR